MGINMSYIANLIENCKKAQVAKPVREFEFSDLAQLDHELDGNCSCIYVIEEVCGNAEETFIEFCKYKDLKERRCPKPNSPCSIMYVGSSTTGLKNRIKQHVGEGPAATYALNLKHWFIGEYKVTVKIYDVPIEVLQIIEDALAYHLSPAFGKRGGNNR